MRQFSNWTRRLAGVTLITLFMAGNASAHIHLMTPNGGEEFETGSVANISWEVLIEHGTQNWDVWYSTTGEKGPWIPIATDLPPGNTSPGSIHTLAWTIPDTTSNEIRVRVRQDNSGTDWYDVSDNDLSIVVASTIPEGSKLLDGVAVGGLLTDVSDSDDQYYELDPSPTMNPNKQKIDLIVQSTSPTGTPVDFSFRIESAMIGGPSGDVIREIALLNYDTGQLELIDIGSAANGDESIEVTPIGDPGRFVQPITNEITGQITWKSDAWIGTPFTWSVDVDEAVWLVSD